MENKILEAIEKLGLEIGNTEKRLQKNADMIEYNLRKDLGTIKIDIGAVNREIAGMKLRLEELDAEVQETRSTVLTIEGYLKDQIEVQSDEVRGVEQRVERIENHVGLPHSLAA